MPVKHCCYGNCISDSRYIGKRPEMNGVFFLPFPKPKTQFEKCQRWVRLCGRKYFGVENITKDTYICCKHFVGEKGPTTSHPDPLPAAATEFERKRLSSKRKRKAPSERKNETPVTKSRKRLIYEEPEEDLTQEADLNEGIESNHQEFGTFDHIYSKKKPETGEFITEPESEETATSILWMPEADVYIDLTEDVTVEVTSYCDSQTQTDDNAMVTSVDTKEIEVQTEICLDNLCEFTTEDFQKHTNITRKLFMKSVLKDDESCKFYTGLTIAMLTYVFTWLQKKAEKLNYWRGQDTTESKTNIKVGPKRKLTTKEEFIITLVRLRRGFDVEVISDLFGVHPSQISRIFTTWINFLYAELKFLISWPSREQIASNIPKAFKHFPTTRSIIDCTEFFVQKPSLPSSQRVTWSQYKHHNTFKALISISPTGTFTFISKLFTGSISDRRIVEESGFLEKIEHGDDIMADRGFLIRDMLARRSATLNIPPFSMGKQLSSRAVTKTRRIASARIHVERAIGRLKTFKILQGVMPLKLHALFDQIVGVCGVLCNLDTQLVK